MTATGKVAFCDGDYARVIVLRSASCGDFCAACGLCGTGRQIEAEVKNPVRAEIGDMVVIKRNSDRPLLYAAAVFLLPAVLPLIAWFIFSRFGIGHGISVSAAAFILSLFGMVILDRKEAKQRGTAGTITEIIKNNKL